VAPAPHQARGRAYIVVTVSPSVWRPPSKAGTSSRLTRVIGGGTMDRAATRDASRSSSGAVMDGWKFTPVTPATGHVILVAFGLVGALNVAVGLPLTVIALTAFRARQRWAWWTVLTASTIALGAPISNDLTTGAIGPFRAARMGPAGGGAAGPGRHLAFLPAEGQLAGSLRRLPGMGSPAEGAGKLLPGQAAWRWTSSDRGGPWRVRGDPWPGIDGSMMPSASWA
jgi:hypothetical protein